MKFRYLISLLTTSLVLLLFSCSDQSGIPKTLQNILDRQGVTTAAGAGSTGSGTSAGSGSYSGPYAADVKALLSKVSGWRTPSCTTCNDGVPPNININPNCQRDAYVFAAVKFAWAAESYARLGKTSEATTQATYMNGELAKARKLCSNSSGIGGSSCLTFTIYSC